MRSQLGSLNTIKILEGAEMLTGTIMAYSKDAEAGVIKANDGKPYYFKRCEWLSNGIKPQNDMRVSFKAGLRCATKVRAYP